jgi:uncharacterized protein with HEPN domain
MPSDREKDWLEDILEAIRLIEAFVKGMELIDFEGDSKARFAVVHALLIISEASRRLSDDLRRRNPGIPWRNVANSGDFYRHKYHSINDKMIWKTVTDQLPSLKQVIQNELNSA